MVRWERLKCDPCVDLLHPFQFHYGAMGARAFANWHVINNKLSIPLWCDGSKLLESLGLSEGLLSIPLWCDGSVVELAVHVSRDLFQFHYGAMGA